MSTLRNLFALALGVALCTFVLIVLLNMILAARQAPVVAALAALVFFGLVGWLTVTSLKS